MNQHSLCPYKRGKAALVLGIGTIGAILALPALGCGIYYPATVPNGREKSAQEHAATALSASQSVLLARAGSADSSQGVVGTWRITMVSDGSAQPAPIPAGAVVDFGTVQLHSDGTELMISGGRAPSTGDACMGAWEQTGARTYEVKHIALAWISSDTPPPVGPASPAMFLGPAIFHESITLDHARNSFTGTFTLDQYGSDETTLLEHIGGTMTGTRFAVD
jgi:hypothetical protein